MKIGLLGKPSSGKSTFFRASTLAETEISSRPFTTISSKGAITYAKVDCVDKEFNTKCNPRYGYCLNSKRFVPFELVDVPGLIKGSHQGKGMGNQFLSDLNEADALIHIIDISGSTDENGEFVGPLEHNPLEDIEFLEKELDMWYLQIFKKGWDKFSRTIQQTREKLPLAISKQLSGLRVTEDIVKQSLNKLKLSENQTSWTETQIESLAHELRIRSKPMIIAANKIDIPGSEKNLQELKSKYPNYIVIPCSAASELGLKESAKNNLISYIPGDSKFEILHHITPEQTNALEYIKRVLEKYNSTGVQDILNTVIFDLLKYVAIFPGGMNKLEDKDGNILPDCFLMKPGSTALDFAYRIHQDLGQNFIKAFNVKTRMIIGRDYKLQHRDVIEIVTRK